MPGSDDTGPGTERHAKRSATGLRGTSLPGDGRVGIITGASSGIGAALARRLAGRVGGLVIHARKSAAALERIAAEVAEAGTPAVTLLGDLTEPDLASRLVAKARDEFGRLDFLVANAGFPILKGFDEGTQADIDYAFAGNVFSFFALARAARELLETAPFGRVVALSSFTAHVFRTDIHQFPLSAASKGALETAVKTLALVLSEREITVNCVVPGFICKDAGTGDSVADDELERTQARIPLRRIGRATEVAAVVDFLLSADASYITGQAIHVNGGLAI